jgi:hypothetical protein
LLIVDEADFGVQRPAQASLLINALDIDDTAILMTGTEAGKAAAMWPIDNMISVVYPELVMEKRNPQPSYLIPMQHFAVDPSRHDLVVDIEFYQMNNRRLVEDFIASNPTVDRDLLASWSKAAANPAKAKGFITHLLQSVFLGQHGYDELNVEHQIHTVATSAVHPAQKVSMMFVPGSTTNANLGHMVSIAESALSPGYKLTAVYGEEMTNRTAEADVKDAIVAARRLGQSSLLVSAGMAQRSFSVGDITEVVLAYDEGSMAGTIQKVARALTPTAAQDKVARLISLSFDSNRDDKFDAMILETAVNYNRSHGIKDLRQSLKQVLQTLWMFRCTPDGAVRMEVDEYLEQAIARRSVSRVIGQVSDLSKLSIAEMEAIAQGNAAMYHAAKQAAAARGRTNSAVGKQNPTPTHNLPPESLIKDVKEVIITVVENMDIMLHGAGAANINEAFDIIDLDHSMQQAIGEEFGIEFALIRDLFDRNVINADLIALQMNGN